MFGTRSLRRRRRQVPDYTELLEQTSIEVFLVDAYRAVFEGPPDNVGFSYFRTQLTHGFMTREEVLGALIESRESATPQDAVTGVTPLVPPLPVDREDLDNHSLVVLMAARLGRTSTFVDIGANTGRFLYHARRLAPEGRHFAFEPLPQLAEHLAVTFPEVTVHSLALSDMSGRTEFVEVLSDPAYSGLKERIMPPGFKTRTIEVAVERLDDVMPPDVSPGFVKIDVEGGQLGVLRGGLGMLRRARPHIAVEHGVGAPAYGATNDELWDLICRDLGMSLYDMDGGGPLDREEFDRLVESRQRWNWFATP